MILSQDYKGSCFYVGQMRGTLICDNSLSPFKICYCVILPHILAYHYTSIGERERLHTRLFSHSYALTCCNRVAFANRVPLYSCKLIWVKIILHSFIYAFIHPFNNPKYNDIIVLCCRGIKYLEQCGLSINEDMEPNCTH